MAMIYPGEREQFRLDYEQGEAEKRRKEEQERIIKTCKNCGKYDPDAGQYCRFCGSPNVDLKRQAEEKVRQKELSSRKCKRCGAHVGGKRFCSECGAAT